MLVDFGVLFRMMLIFFFSVLADRIHLASFEICEDPSEKFNIVGFFISSLVTGSNQLFIKSTIYPNS